MIRPNTVKSLDYSRGVLVGDDTSCDCGLGDRIGQGRRGALVGELPVRILVDLLCGWLNRLWTMRMGNKHDILETAQLLDWYSIMDAMF